jgi:hypothetical protein
MNELVRCHLPQFPWYGGFDTGNRLMLPGRAMELANGAASASAQ